VAPSKQVNVSPIGPIRGREYASAPGLGYGLIFSPDAASRYIENNVYHYRYDPTAVSAELVAVPYKTSFDINGDLVPYQVTNYINRVIGLPGTTALGCADRAADAVRQLCVRVRAVHGSAGARGVDLCRENRL
jgi:hypothetical protein